MQRSLCIVYIVCLALGTLQFYCLLFALGGVYISGWFMVVLATGWLVCCFSGDRWLGPLFLATLRIRKPILEEDEWLHPIQHELQLRAQLSRVPVLYILEEPWIHAFTCGKDIVVLSRGLLVHLNEKEIQAILAHEYGHLRDKDTQLSAAFVVAGAPLSFLYRLFAKLLLLFRIRKSRKVIVTLVIIGIILVLMHRGTGLMLVVFSIFITLYPTVAKIIDILWCQFCRHDEFRQDAFAQSLGCGRALKSALLKMDALGSENLVPPALEFSSSTHPMLYRRVRRLEWLEGQRPTP